MKASTRDRVGSVVALLFVASLWLQRSYTTPFDGIFPDAIMVILTVIVVTTLVLSFTSHRAMKDAGAAQGADQGNWMGMVVVGAILLAWAVLLRTLGFALTGVLGFTAISWYLAGLPKDPKVIGRSLLVAALVTGVLMLVFGRMLKVPLPPGSLFS
jgi:hypothetical protein